MSLGLSFKMIDARIRFRHLRTLVETARYGSIGKAADALAVTQPAATKSMRELEEIVGRRLVEKAGRGIRITPYGEVFLRYAGASIAALQQGLDSLGAASDMPPLRIGALPTASARIMPDLMTAFRAEAPDAPVTIVTGENRVLLDQLRLGELDLVIGRLAASEQMAGLKFSYLYSEDVRLVVRPGHPLLAHALFPFEHLRAFPILMPPEGSIIRPLVDRLLLTHGVQRLPNTIETVSETFGRAFTSQSDAVWIISEGVVLADIATGRLCALAVDTSETRGGVGLTVRETGDHHPAIQLLERLVKAMLVAQPKGRSAPLASERL